MAAELIPFAPGDLQSWTVAMLLKAETPLDIAELVAKHLVGANRAGHDSHGVLRLPAYLGQMDRGLLMAAARPSILHESPTTATLDGAHGFGYTTMEGAVSIARDKAEASGLAAVAIRNCGHIGRVGGWVEELAHSGLIGQLTYGSIAAATGGATPFGGKARMLGTNPWAIAIPASDNAPVVLDFATTGVAEGKLQVARAKRQTLPAGLIVDKQGQPSVNVEDFYAGGMLLPFGGHKGYALSIVAALFGGLAGATAVDRVAGVFLVALNPSAFGDAGDYTRAVTNAKQVLRSTPAVAQNMPVQVPGDPERASRTLRSRWLPLPAETVRQLQVLAERFSVPLPAPFAGHQFPGEVLAATFGVAPTAIMAALAGQVESAKHSDMNTVGALLVENGTITASTLEAALATQL